MSTNLLVPVQIDALCLDKDQLVVEAKADFSQLPYQKEGIDKNPNSLNISDTVLSKEFQNLNLTLNKGVHLHWALPDGLTMGIQDDSGKVKYPHIPNRWLISKYVDDQLSDQWMVESDYLHPQGEDNTYGSVTYPIDLNPDKYEQQVIETNTKGSPYQPYRYIGRQVPLEEWNENENADRLRYLTVAGYGTPSFAAFYPDCYSILGFREEGAPVDSDTLNRTQYTIVGWYADSKNDPLNQLITGNSNASVEDIRNKIIETFNWEIPEDTNEAPSNIVCFGNISFNASGDSYAPDHTADVEVALGNSGKEALAAYMAAKFHTDNKNIAEEQLMAIQLSDMVNTTGIDVGPAFNQAFHNDQFLSSNGQTVWIVSIQNNGNNSTDSASQNNKDQTIQLPPTLSHLLNDLNLTQAEYEQAQHRIEGQRHALFSDWYKYMVSAYPNSDQLGDYPDMNLIRYYILHRSIPELTNLLNQTGEVTYQFDEATGYVTSVDGVANTLSDQVGTFFDQVKSLVDLYNTGTPNPTYFTALFNKGGVPDEVNTDAGISWETNTPITEQCLQFSGSNYLNYIIPEGCRGVSFWVKINAQQNGDAVFFALEEVNNSSIGVEGFGTYWNRVCINGTVVNPEINKDWSTFPKDQWIHIYLESASIFSGNLFIFSSDGTQNFTNGNLASFRLFNGGLSEDDIYTDRNIFLKNKAIIQRQKGGSYYQPKEPVLLFTGKDVQPSLRHGYDGRQHEEDLMSCIIDENLVLPLSSEDLPGLSLLEDIRNNIPESGKELLGYQLWQGTPWNPIIFEWESAIYPLQKGNELSTAAGNYQTSFIEDNFLQEMNREQLVLKDETVVSQSPQVYTGYTFITTQAQQSLQAQVIIFLNNLLSNDFITQFGITQNTQEEKDQFNAWMANKPVITESNFTEYSAWIDTLTFDIPTELENNIISQAIGAYTEVIQLNIQSQSLGGFNQALLMFNQALQLPVSDALGFEDAKVLSNTVAGLVGSANKSVAHPLNSFMPLRTGDMNLLRVRIVDTFGQYKDVDLDGLVITESMTAGTDRLHLPPAISQPARLNLRWLAADNGEQEVNSAQGSNPICGWLVANFMDLSIMVYDQNGYSLGSIDRNAFWQPTPGDSTPLDPRFIENNYLQNVVRQLSITDGQDNQSKADYINAFIHMMNEALTNITPSNYSQQSGTAILMGRPIAVVRSSIDLEVKGNLAVNQSWNTFRVDLNAEKRTTNDFENVLFPLRIGDRSQLNDGVVGYWLEDDKNALLDAFYTTIEANKVINENIVSFESAPSHLQQSIASTAQNLTMLIDPNGSVHAYSGVLPTKIITIPSSKFADALKNINITFLSSPIVTPRDKVAVSLPNEAGFNWSWVAKQGQAWKTVGSTGIVTINDFTSRFNNGLDIWNVLVGNNWISTQDNATAQVVAQDQRTTTDLGGAFSTQLVEIQNMLTAAQINPFSFDGTFKDPVEAIEGWLKLSPQ